MNESTEITWPELTHILVKKHKKKTSDLSEHPSRPSFNDAEEALMTVMKEIPQDSNLAKKQALIRDGYRCVVTGKYNLNIPASFDVNEEEVKRVGTCWTECAHIVQESIYSNISNEESLTSIAKRDSSASLLTVLKRFGYDVENINGDKMHSLHNVMTLEKNVHEHFDRLELWFEATEIEHCYRIKTFSKSIQVPNTTTFVRSGTHLDSPLPSPELLAHHASCAKVAHLSGAAEYLDELDRDWDDLPVLAADGRSSNVLNNALLRSLNSISSLVGVEV
ncbi:hypothetical protein E1B28_011454 [Marasmius oreades]|uniref:HNH nuclease domain-containing protein n=1 Tax=Marasmius oreades TaxID=181124 RepID=A0A9P7RU54_9AGAR|nr:uncharacterized protein E1B28_011454 [Marasmius oreades]KAG7089804.1 hypothetical protein E1B28_011454 [Marasmius oreades]